MGLKPVSALEDLPEDEQERRDKLHRVVGEEASDIELGTEGRPSIDENDNGLQEEGNVGTVGLEVSAVGQRLAVEALGLACVVKVDVRDGHDEVVDNAAARDEGQQPVEHLCGAAAALQEGEQGEDHGDGEAVDGHTVLGGLAEQGRGATVERQAVQGPGRAVDVGVTGGEDGSEQQSIDQVGETLDLEVLHGHDPRGGSGGATAAGSGDVDVDEGLVVVGKHDAARQGGADKEEAETQVDGLEGALDVQARVLRLGGDHGDVFRADNGERGSGQSTHEAFHATSITLRHVFRECAGLLPVSESIGIMSGVSSDHRDEGEEEEDEDEQDLAA